MADSATQRTYTAPCPGCGAPVEFRSAQSIYLGLCRQRAGGRLRFHVQFAPQVVFQQAVALQCHARLAHLLEITGPGLAPELLARLTEDLTATRDTLAFGAAETDWKRLREGSHVLISLSGSVGALSLQAMSESLNAIAHAQDRPALAALLPPLDAELAALIRLIRATRAPQGPAA